MSRKNPFINYTVEEILASEAVSYIIIVNDDIYEDNGKFIFNKKNIVKHYNKILVELAKKLHLGTRREKIKAAKVLSKFRIEPLRVH